MKLETFYNLLVKELKTNDSPSETCVFVENRNDVIQISQTFHGKSDFFRSYVMRTIMEVVLGLLMLTWLCVYGLQETLEVSNKIRMINYLYKSYTHKNHIYGNHIYGNYIYGVLSIGTVFWMQRLWILVQLRRPSHCLLLLYSMYQYRNIKHLYHLCILRNHLADMLLPWNSE